MLTKVKYLHFYNLTLSAADHDRVSFLSYMKFARNLTVSPSTLRNILDLQSIDRADLFPCLEKLTFFSFHHSHISFIYAFLKCSKDLGFAISVVEFRGTSHQLVELGHLAVLDNIVGLKVEWESNYEKQEYVCGSGDPGALDFTRVHR